LKAPTGNARIEALLIPAFSRKHVVSLLRHFTDLVTDFQVGKWDDSLTKVGKFVEAVLKALFVHVGDNPPSGRGFKADHIINGLANKPQGVYDDSIRLVVPRACRFVYDIASNRGGRHDPEDINPNEMDANASVSICSWILAELIRISQRGAVELEEAKELADSLTQKKYPFIEDVDGRVYFYLKKKTAPDIALVALAHAYPGRISRQDLVDTIKRNGFKDDNARKAVLGISGLVDNDGHDQLRLLAPGLQKAEQIMKEKAP
jgi:hypothetical protein